MMSTKIVNFKKLTATSLLALSMAGSFVIEPVLSAANPNAPGQNKKACKNNNGIGNNYDIEVILPSGTSLTIRIDPGNSGQMNKFAGYLALTYGIDSTVFDTVIKPQIVDAEMRAKTSNTKCPSGSSVTTGADFTTTNTTGTPVSVELVLSVDVSASVDSTEFNLQKNGYKAAFQDSEVKNAIKKLPDGLAVNMQFWADSGNILETGWFKLTNDTTISSFVTKFDSVTRQAGQNRVRFGNSGQWTVTGSGTDIKLAIDKATNSIVNNAYNGKALVIDVSGDGVSDDTPYTGSGNEDGECPHSHFCPPLEAARDAALAQGITINGLPIVNNQNKPKLTHEVDIHYKKLVIGGEDSFVEVAKDFSSFTSAAKKKILKEINQAGNLVASAVDDAFTTNEDTNKTGNVLTNDKNPANASLKVTEVNGVAANVGKQFSLATGALVKVNQDGSFTYNPNSKFEQLNDGENKLDNFSYTMSDGTNISSATVSMSISGITDAPPAPPNQAPDAKNYQTSTNKNTFKIIDIIKDAKVTDADGDTLVISSVNFNPNDAHGTVEIVDGKLKYTPTTDFAGTATFEYTISDGQGGTATAEVKVLVNDVPGKGKEGNAD
jgi:VCBS repeat-containing protein